MAEAKKTKTTKKVTAKTENALSIPVFGVEGTESKRLDLPKELFDVHASPRLLAQYIRVYLANQRQGNASTKTRGEVKSSSKKIYRQKGTGKARHGTITAPIFVGGGIAGGPKPRDFSLQMNKKQKKKALLYSLSLKAHEGSIIGLDNELLKVKPKTKLIFQMLKKIGVDNQSVLCIVPTTDDNGLLLSIRNLPKVEIVSANSINAYQITKHKKVAIVEKAIDVMKESFVKAN